MNPGMENRRSEPRFLADQPVTVTVMNTAKEESGAGRIVDFSASGIGLEIEFSVEPGSKVRVQWPRGLVLGEIRYCLEKAPRNFRAGLMITEVVTIADISEQSGAA